MDSWRSTFLRIIGIISIISLKENSVYMLEHNVLTVTDMDTLFLNIPQSSILSITNFRIMTISTPTKSQHMDIVPTDYIDNSRVAECLCSYG